MPAPLTLAPNLKRTQRAWSFDTRAYLPYTDTGRLSARGCTPRHRLTCAVSLCSQSKGSYTVLRNLIVTLRQLAAFFLFLAALSLLALAISLLWPVAGDYYSLSHPATLAIVRDESLYETGSAPFYNAPWLLGVWIPFVAFPYPVGQFANTILILASAILSIRIFWRAAPPWAILFAFVNWPAAAIVANGQVDTFVLLAVAMGYVAARRRHGGLLAVSLALLAAKPTSVMLVALWFLAGSQRWRAIGLTLGAVIVSAFFVGTDWLIRYPIYLIQNPLPEAPRVELWRYLPVLPMVAVTASALLAMVYRIRHTGFNEETFLLALIINLVVAPYVLWAHFILLVPAMLYLARHDWRLATLAWGSSWLIPTFAMIYPLTLLILVCGIGMTLPNKSVIPAK